MGPGPVLQHARAAYDAMGTVPGTGSGYWPAGAAARDERGSVVGVYVYVSSHRKLMGHIGNPSSELPTQGQNPRSNPELLHLNYNVDTPFQRTH